MLQSTPQVVALQTGPPLGGSTQAVQPPAVQPDAVLLFATHDVGAAAGQPWKPVAQVTLQVVPLQAAAPLVGVAHAVQPLAEQPEATLLLATQVAFAPPPHRWKPVLQARTQLPPVPQVTVPFAGAVHTVQLLPHEAGFVLPLITQVAFAPVPQRWYPVVQSIPHASGFPSQVATPFAGAAQGVQAAVVAVVPHDMTLLLSAQTLPQR